MQRQLNESINIAIMENQKNAHGWRLHGIACELYWWFDFFNIALFKDQPVPVPAISFERTKITALGNYVAVRNAFGIKENINLNRAHLKRPLWDILATLLHEMTHSWQAIYGKPSKSWFHNKEFCLKMESFGILCNNKGDHTAVGDPFLFLLKKHAVGSCHSIGDSGFIAIPSRQKPKGHSKLKKWQCPCGQTARVGKKAFYASCILCNELFVLTV